MRRVSRKRNIFSYFRNQPYKKIPIDLKKFKTPFSFMTF